MDEHTPGPWRVDEDWDEATVAIRASDGAFAFLDVERLPDARLIAAAPDLLEALEELVDAGFSTPNRPHETLVERITAARERRRRALEAARDAINKATNRTTNPVRDGEMNG